jgi:hypothetical protein
MEVIPSVAVIVIGVGFGPITRAPNLNELKPPGM